jgi:hypothetical protein
MNKNELLRRLQDAMDAGVAAAERDQWAIEDNAEDPDIAPPEWPTLSEFATGMQRGFSASDERRVHPVSLWTLARYLVEGDRFAFAPALREHLTSQVRPEDEALWRSSFVSLIAAAIRRLHASNEDLAGLREQMMAWESRATSFLMHLPAAVASFADDDPEPFGARHELPGEVVVTLQEVRTRRLEVRVARPADVAGPDRVFVTLTGDGAGGPITVPVTLTGAGRYVGGRASDLDFKDTSESLGQNWVVMVSSEPPPDMPE